MTELDKYIERKTEDLGVLGITDSPSEEYLKEICEGYYKIKQGQSLPIDSVSVTLNSYINYLRKKIEKQKELHRLTKELVKQMTGRDIDDTQDADYQIAYYYLNKAINYTHCCKSDSEQLLEIEKLCRMNQNFVCNCIDDSRCPNF